jgi:glycosyl transferase family 25
MSKYIDKIFYINLDKRTDRRNEIEEELLRFGLEGERYSAIYTPESGIVGCGYSHLNVLKLARDRGYNNVLILEDDFQFIVSKEEFEEEMTRFFKCKKHYDVLMLSYIVQETAETEFPFLGKVLNGQTASGYLINKHYINILIELYEWAIPLLQQTNHHWLYANDHVWKRLQPPHHWFYLKKRIGKQRESYSDNKMCYVENNDGA